MTACGFVVDGMLIRLGKYLRIIGCDAVWDAALGTAGLIRKANAEGRVFLTRNRRLSAEHPGAKRVLVLGTTDPVEQFETVVREFGIDPQARLFSRCVRCNVELDAVPDRETVMGRVQPGVYASHRRFFRCRSCGTIFWHGSHVANTCRKLKLVRPPANEPAATGPDRDIQATASP
jgi:uncharacterized protein with PIN domain